MRFLINGHQVTECYFWTCLQGIAGKHTKRRLLDGWNVWLDGATYRITGISTIDKYIL